MLERNDITSPPDANRAYDADELIQAETLARKAEIELRELLRRELVGEASDETDTSDEESQSYWHMLGLRILENLQVEVTNIHVRFEDKQVIDPVFGGSAGDDAQRKAGEPQMKPTTSIGSESHSLAIGVTLDCISFRNEDPSSSPLAAADDGGDRPTSSPGLSLATAQSAAATTVPGYPGTAAVGEGTGPGVLDVSKRFSVVSFAVYVDEGEVDVSRPWDGLKSDSLDGSAAADGGSSESAGTDAGQQEGGKSKGKGKGKGNSKEKGNDVDKTRATALAALVRRLRRLGPGGRELIYVLKPISFSAVVLKREIHQSGPSAMPVGVGNSPPSSPTPSFSPTPAPSPPPAASSSHESSAAPPPAHSYTPTSTPSHSDGQCAPRWQLSCRTEEAEVVLTSSQLRCGLALQRRVVMVQLRRAVILIRPRRRPGLAPRGAWWRFAAEATGAVRPLRTHRGWLGFLHAFRLRRRFIQVQQRALGRTMGLSWVAPLSQNDEDWLEAVTRDRRLPVEVILLWRAVAKVELQAVESKKKTAGLAEDAALDANDPMATTEVDVPTSSRAAAPSASSKLFAKAPRGSTMRRTSAAASSAVKAAGKLKKALSKSGGLSSKGSEAGGKEGKASNVGGGTAGAGKDIGAVGDAVAGSGSSGGVASGKGKGKGKGTKGRMWNNVFGKSKPSPSAGTGDSGGPGASSREAEDINVTGAAVELSSAELEELQGTVESEMRSLAQLAEMQGTVDWVHLHAELPCVRLRVSDAEGPIALGHITGFEANLTQRGLPGQKKRALALVLELGDVMVMDVCTPDTKYPELLRPATAFGPDALGSRGDDGSKASGGPNYTPTRPKKRQPTFLLRVDYEPARVLEYEPVAAAKALASSPWSVVAEGRAFEAVLVRCECTRRLYDCFNHTFEEEEHDADPFDPSRISLEGRGSLDGFSTPRVQKIGSGHLQTPQHHAQQTIRSAERAASTLTRLAHAQASAVESAVAQHTANQGGTGDEKGGQTSPMPLGSSEMGKSSNGKRGKRKREKPPWRVGFKMQAPFVVSLATSTA